MNQPRKLLDSFMTVGYSPSCWDVRHAYPIQDVTNVHSGLHGQIY